ncbi:lipocalin family protein [uncultured Flavobacterium sp.]|uniref:lipocalin family protein n=1 Tax=uncultured Flavobacterium sp. TaxID=165435 RepID=UPI0030EE72EC|tara:strand:- start:41640 stop:42080 length:441 start_codon:yes stop_codon:yes gene_type:complete
MKKFKKLTVLFLVISVVLASCNKDDDSSSAAIEGSWELTKSGSITADGNEQLMDYPFNNVGCNKDYIEIITGGTTAEHYFNDDNNGQGCYEEIEIGTYTKEGNVLTIISSGYTQIGEILELNNSTLKVKYSYPNSTVIEIIVYKRK